MAIYLVSAIAALMGLLFGFDTGIISGALLFIEKGFPLTTIMKELIVSSVLLGAMLGSVSSGNLTDRYGRRLVILIISGLFIIGTLIASLATSVQFILIGRLCIGFAIGIGSYTAPLYIAEVSPYKLRGALVSLNQLAITIGIMCSYFINYLFTNTNGSWRFMFAIGLIPAVLLCIGMIFLPESPRWLVKQKRSLEAKKTLRYLRRSNENQIDQEINDIEKSLTFKEASLFEVFSPWIRPVLFLGIMMGFLQQVTGINTIIYYAPTIFQLAGFHDASSSILATAGIGIVNVLATIFAVCYLDKIGRRMLLLVGLVGMCISLIVLSFAFKWQSTYLSIIAMLSTFTYVICFAFSLGTMLWLLVSEIFPLEVRGAAMSIAIFSGWFWNFIVSSTFLSLLNAFGPSNTFLLYAVMCVFGFIYCYYKAPETKGITLEQIEENIRSGLPIREIGIPAYANTMASSSSKQQYVNE
ncbi:MAG: hypothetical protein A3F12_03525 [Gammaproteobacteria bacterium RIFCSPHIGHO2_12_FULL_38_14]|nr:MAG: hypothetical protein A3F12_03525 [Gammaproteobacteria bacterium RIFCSPHIGHO2_12_FULL_38_14]